MKVFGTEDCKIRFISMVISFSSLFYLWTMWNKFCQV